MKYCSECGTAISSQATACPSCRALLSSETDKSKVDSDIMDKGKEKSLQNDYQELVESLLNVNTNSNKGLSNTEKNDVGIEKYEQETKVPPNESNVSWWILTYLVLNLILIPFVYFNIVHYYAYIDYSDLTSIIYMPKNFLAQDIYFLLSVFILFSVFKRKGMPIPFNGFVNALLILQLCLSGYVLYINTTHIMVLMTINFLMFALLILNIILLFQGNKDRLFQK